MTKLNGNIILDIIKTSVGQLETIRPAYSSILGLFGPIFLAQEKTRELVSLHLGEVTGARLESFEHQESYLIDKAAFKIDMASAKLLFGEICTIAAKSSAMEMQPDTMLMQTVTAEDFDPEPLFLAVSNDDKKNLHDTAFAYQTTSEALKLLAYNSIKPSLESCASAMKGYLSDDIFWRRQGCPVCGSMPVLSVLDAGANRSLICGFCWSEWKVERIQCPFCHETNSRKLHYKYFDEEKEYRIDACDSCRSYLKTIDTREMDRAFYAPLESLVSAHLDLLMENYHLV